MIGRLPLLAVLGLAACSSPPEPPAPEPAEAGEGLARALLEGSWAADLEADPSGVQAVLEGPSGDAWIALFHRDLDGAARGFAQHLEAEPGAASSRLGLARVHLARASAYAAASDLHLAAAQALVAYRSEHRGRVRLGPYERALARVISPEAAPEPAGDPVVPGDAAVLAALDALIAGEPSTLPAPWSEVRSYAAAVGAGDLPEARRLLSALDLRRPDLVDPLGVDDETGLTFSAEFYDPVRLGALAAHQALEARSLAGAVPGLESILTVASPLHGTLPADAPAAVPWPADAPAEVPGALVHFAAPWITPRDAPGGVDGSLLGLLAAQAPGTFSADPDAAAIDRELRAVADLEAQLASLLGPGLSTELNVPRNYIDRILRRRMEQLGDSHPALAVRLGRRSLDVNAGANGGPASSSRTRVSWRNDRAFLIRFAHQLWRAGHPADALDLLHPLAQEDPALQPVVHYLGQLDAANSVGTAGKASQL